MIRGCNRDCFHCIFEDCIEDGIDSSERRSINKRDTENQSILPDAVLRQHRVLLAVEKNAFCVGELIRLCTNHSIVSAKKEDFCTRY